jgi:hypothetical protein
MKVVIVELLEAVELIAGAGAPLAAAIGEDDRLVGVEGLIAAAEILG